jgi:hypothetical protein
MLIPRREGPSAAGPKKGVYWTERTLLNHVRRQEEESEARAVTIQAVKLRSREPDAGRPPPDPIGSLMRRVPVAVGMAVRMAFRGRSTSRGRKPRGSKR